MSSPSLDALIARGIAGASSAASDDEWEAVWATLEPVRGLGQDAYLAGVALLQGSPTEQQLGCMLLRVGLVTDDEWREPAVNAILAMAAEGPNDVTLDFVADALGDFGLPVGLPLLLTLSRHPDEEIRLTAVTAIPACCGPEYRGVPGVVETLLTAMTDENEDVRDWATFGLGRQLADDSTEIRDALADRLEDLFLDVHCEAIAGLARRRDGRAIEPTLVELGQERVQRIMVEAAEYLASDVLLPSLLALADDWEQSFRNLDRAIAACDPAARQQQATEMGLLLDALADAGVDASISVELFSTDTTLNVANGRTPWTWDLHRLTAPAGDTAGVVTLVIEALNSN
jgi:HEAT repeats